MASLTALSAIDGYLLSLGVSSNKLPTSIEVYEKAIKKILHNGKIRAALVTVYQNLHIFGYYRGGVGVGMIKEGSKGKAYRYPIRRKKRMNFGFFIRSFKWQ